MVLPLDYGLSLAQTARGIDRSPAWACRLRNRFLAGEMAGDGQRASRSGRGACVFPVKIDSGYRSNYAVKPFNDHPSQPA